MDAEPTLSITEVTERTGVPQATLRTWEARYGFPEATRLPGGHRRYTEEVVGAVQQVLGLRAGGLALEAAIRRVHDDAATGSSASGSIFAELRRTRPQLTPQLISQPLMLALSNAIEDECCARAQRPTLFASFQQERFYRASQPRWTELARTARSAVVFADFPNGSNTRARPAEIALPHDAQLHREWAVVCDAPDNPACLVGWERPGQHAVPGGERWFEAVWTVDPRSVRDVARACARLTELYGPEAGPSSWPALEGSPPPASADLRRASGLLNRVLGYVESVQRGRDGA